MGLNVSQGVFSTAASGTTDIAVTGLGFAPSTGHCVIWFWGSAATANQTNAQGASLCKGVAISTTAADNSCVSLVSRDSNDGGAGLKAILRANQCYEILKPSDTLEGGRLLLKSLDADGFTLTVSAAFNATYLVHYQIWSGSDIVNVAVGQKAIAAASASPESVTGLSFQPTQVLALVGGLSLTATNTLTLNSGIGFGGYDGTNQMSWMISGNAAGGANNFSELRTNRFLTVNQNASSVERINCQMTSLNSDGFTYTVTRGAGAEQPFYTYVALNISGGHLAIASLQTQTSTGNFTAVSGLGWRPTAVLLNGTTAATASQTASNSIVEASLGGAISSTKRGAVWAISPTAAQDTESRSDTAQCYVDWSRTGSKTYAVAADMDFVSMDSGGITLNQTTADAAQHLVLAILVNGSTAAGPTWGNKGSRNSKQTSRLAA